MNHDEMIKAAEEVQCERVLTKEQQEMEDAAGYNIDWGLVKLFPKGIGREEMRDMLPPTETTEE